MPCISFIVRYHGMSEGIWHYLPVFVQISPIELATTHALLQCMVKILYSIMGIMSLPFLGNHISFRSDAIIQDNRKIDLFTTLICYKPRKDTPSVIRRVSAYFTLVKANIYVVIIRVCNNKRFYWPFTCQHWHIGHFYFFIFFNVFYAVRISYAFGCHYYHMNLNSLGHCICVHQE